MEDDLKKIIKKNGRRPKKKEKKKEDDLNKLEDKPINQIQPNWL